MDYLIKALDIFIWTVIVGAGAFMVAHGASEVVGFVRRRRK